VLRITRYAKEGAVWLKLEGKLVGPWVDECRSACTREILSAKRPSLDLSGVRFIDSQGVELLRQLRACGIEMPHRSSFVAELLRDEGF
jgi:anti-anti-sigma regulatory factor